MSNIAKTTRAIRFTETGGPKVLKIENLEVPAPEAHEVRLEVKAIGVNRADSMYRQGFYVETPVFPSRLGYEAAGIIEAVGEDVKDYKVGDIVSVIPAFSLNSYGTYGELILLPAYTLQKHPKHLTWEQAASIWTSFISMYGLVVDAAEVKAGQAVILTAASSSAGLAGIQFVNYVGGVSIAITSTALKREKLLAAGAQHVIVSSEQDIKAEVMRITNNKGADVVLDAVAGPLFEKLVAATADKGKIYVYGALSQQPAIFPALDVLIRTPVIKGYTALDILGNQEKLKRAIDFIYQGIEEEKLKPIVGKTFSFDQIPESQYYLEGNQQFGKIVIMVNN